MRDIGNVFDITPGTAAGLCKNMSGIHILKDENGKTTGVWRKE